MKRFSSLISHLSSLPRQRGNTWFRHLGGGRRVSVLFYDGHVGSVERVPHNAKIGTLTAWNYYVVLTK